ncbi:ABC transporter substrate-binding protein [Thermomonospora umbrina]|uniref:Iron complex transport system substrate-binding protein n=1 Tax=Thermomonospora umbrina TaxID=111806 RepID=A0A3D9SYL2_9ACTN|nr:ABC transporter substrate-binding protein [Thermomonospora umbrina]REF01053.1 iron complex transport system substrate-binding protein [Thermomonospora umbrina]
MKKIASLIPVVAAALLATACGGAEDTAGAGSSAAPVTVRNCGTAYLFAKTPERVVTSSTVATEVLLALGLRDRLAGTVAAKDIVPEYAPALRGVRVIAESAFPPPSKEVVYSADPDLVISGYPDDYGPKAMGDRAVLQKEGVNTYLLSANCPGHKAGVEDVYADVRALGQVFGVQDRAEALVRRLQTEVHAVKPVAGSLKVFDYAGGKDKPATAGSGALVDDLIRRAGGTNIFPEVASYKQVSWEEIVKRDPDAILVEDQAFEPADKAIAWMRSYGPLKNVTAVKENRFIVIPVNDTQPGVRSGRALMTLTAGLAR